MKTIYTIRLRELREAKGDYQRVVASAINAPRSTYTQWESGRIRMPLEALIDVARYFDVSLDYLIGNHDEFGNLLTEEEIEKILNEDKRNQN